MATSWSRPRPRDQLGRSGARNSSYYTVAVDSRRTLARARVPLSRVAIVGERVGGGDEIGNVMIFDIDWPAIDPRSPLYNLP